MSNYLSIKLFLILFLNVLIVGCGGGGTGVVEESGEEMTGNCVSFPRESLDSPTPTNRITSYQAGTEVIEFIDTVVSSVVAANDTMLSFENATTFNGITSFSIETQSFTVSNNFKDITDVVTTLVNDDINFENIVIKRKNTPFARSFIDNVCENQTLTQTYDSLITTTPGTLPTQRTTVTRITTIEAVNQTKTVEAGTFNTFIIRSDNENNVNKSWIDQASGSLVFQEVRDFSDNLISTNELIELTN